ncbi:hypothetical protein BDV96DRAFT_607497 [Lophiotrema nucula]|uniref:Uncharacterized protein n=1 Tax=Lophiotrema nucula TaxID=690887 RepID=A0A6A5YJF3_9PLEO|nr:hypothetical protein BDV96DRAFT_607497 [Lophiotrema nucula]
MEVETSCNSQGLEVILVRYSLSYSASCPPLTSLLARLYERSVPPSWLSHYALRIGEYYFDLYREGWLPFASIAYFGIINSKDVQQMRRTLGEKPKWIAEDLKLGTTSLNPEEVILKRIGFFLGVFVLLPSTAPLRLTFYGTCTAFHLFAWIIVLNDIILCRRRLQRLHNEWRYLDTRSYDNIPWINRYSSRLDDWRDLLSHRSILFMSARHAWYEPLLLCLVIQWSLAPFLVLFFYWLSLHGFWTTIDLFVLATGAYYVMIYLPARHTLNWLRSMSQILNLSKAEDLKRVDLATAFLRKWYLHRLLQNPNRGEHLNALSKVLRARRRWIGGWDESGLEHLLGMNFEDVPFSRAELKEAFVDLWKFAQKPPEAFAALEDAWCRDYNAQELQASKNTNAMWSFYAKKPPQALEVLEEEWDYSTQSKMMWRGYYISGLMGFVLFLLYFAWPILIGHETA